jgi:hypothetical protein
MKLPLHKLEEVDYYYTNATESLWSMGDKVVIHWKPRTVQFRALGFSFQRRVRERPLVLRFRRSLIENGMYRTHPACAILLEQLNEYFHSGPRTPGRGHGEDHINALREAVSERAFLRLPRYRN